MKRGSSGREKAKFNTSIRSDILCAAKTLAVLQRKTFAAIFEEALVDVIRKHGREDLIPQAATQRRLFHG